jgi:hypothetical protein
VQEVAVVRLEVADVVEEGDGSDDRPDTEHEREGAEGGDDEGGDEVYARGRGRFGGLSDRAGSRRSFDRLRMSGSHS